MLYAIEMKDGTQFQVEAISPSNARSVSSVEYTKRTGKNSYCVKAIPVSMCGPLKLVEA